MKLRQMLTDDDFKGEFQFLIADEIHGSSPFAGYYSTDLFKDPNVGDIY